MFDSGHNILNAIDDGALIINRDYEIIFANHSFLKLYQTTSDNIIGEKCHTISHQCSVPCLEQCILKKVFKEGVPVTHEHHHLLADGSKRFFQISASPLKNDQGKTVQMLQILKDVTEQHQQKIALSTSHLELERIFNSAPFTISYLDRQMRILRLNPAMEKCINMTTEEVKGKYCYDIWGQYAKDETKKESKRICDSCRSQYALTDGKRYVYERQLGDTFFEILSVPVFDRDHSIIGVMEIGTDITERKQAEEALFLERNNFNNILNSMDDGIYIVNAHYDIEYVNTVIKEEFGKIQGQKCFAYFHGRNDVCPWCKNQEVLQGKTVRWECFSSKNQKTYDLIDTPFKNPDGTLSKLEILRDITDRKQAEKALQKSKEEWERTFDSIPDIVTLQNTDLRIVKVNQMGCDTLGLACNAIIGHHCYELFHGAEEPCDLCPLLLTKKDFKPYSREMYHEKLGKTFLVSAAPVLDEHGALEYIAHIAKDVTEQKKMQRESDQRLQQVIQANKLASLGEVVAGVAHEINNPNSFISYNIPLLEDIWQVLLPRVDKRGTTSSQETSLGNVSVNELCQDMDGIIEAIKLGSERINRVVDNLKDFARLDESSHSESVQLNEVIEKTYSIVGAQVRRTVHNIEFHLAKNLPLVMGHFQKLEQIIANLLINAAHALQEKSHGKISISTHFIERLDSVVVTIEDNGIGMEPKTIARLFEPFFTTRRNSGGTGLGLSISYGLVREHAGTIAVLSRPGIGTRFTLLLPKKQGSDPLDLRPAILLMGEIEILSDLKEMLHEVTESAIFTLNEQERILPFLEEHPEVDIVLSTIKSPHLNGWKILDEIKKHFPLVAVFLYTESVDHTDTRTPFKPDYLLQKPFKTAQLQDCIDSINRIRL
jgi:PAS domain S-box-containing protein